MSNDKARRDVAALAICGLLLLSSCSSKTEPDPTRSPSNLISTPWRLLSQKGRTLVVVIESGGCIDFDHMDVVESDSEVTLTALSADKTDAGQTCTAERNFDVAAACLDEPLGDRKLSRALISPEWPGEQSIKGSLPPGLGASTKPCPG